MARRHRILLAAVVMVALAAAGAVIAVQATDHPMPPAAQQLPTCAEIYAFPGVTYALATAFGDTWALRKQDDAPPGSMTNCSIDASFEVFDWTARPPGTPHSRLFILLLAQVPPDPELVQRAAMCRDRPGTTEPIEEPGLGDGAYSCWAGDDFGGYQNLHHYLRVQVGGISVLMTLSGADYGPLGDPAVDAELHDDLERNTGCVIAPVLAGLGAPVANPPACGEAGRAV